MKTKEQLEKEISELEAKQKADDELKALKQKHFALKHRRDIRIGNSIANAFSRFGKWLERNTKDDDFFKPKKGDKYEWS